MEVANCENCELPVNVEELTEVTGAFGGTFRVCKRCVKLFPKKRGR